VVKHEGLSGKTIPQVNTKSHTNELGKGGSSQGNPFPFEKKRKPELRKTVGLWGVKGTLNFQKNAEQRGFGWGGGL